MHAAQQVDLQGREASAQHQQLQLRVPVAAQELQQLRGVKGSWVIAHRGTANESLRRRHGHRGADHGCGCARRLAVRRQTKRLVRQNRQLGLDFSAEAPSDVEQHRPPN